MALRSADHHSITLFPGNSTTEDDSEYRYAVNTSSSTASCYITITITIIIITSGMRYYPKNHIIKTIRTEYGVRPCQAESWTK
jgi:hypothetical protein